jgi:two-component system, NtrC family, sensor kinase
LESYYYGLSELYSSQGSYKEAYNYYKLHVLYRDSLGIEEAAKKVVQTRMQYEFDKKEAVAKAEQGKKDAEQKRIRNLQYFAIGALLLTMIVIVMIALIQWRNSKQRQHANLLLQQQKEKIELTLNELKSTQAQLIQKEKMASLGELTAGIAHEIQNPLNFVNNFSETNTELLLEMKQELGKGDIEQATAIADDVIDNNTKIHNHGKRAESIVKGMLEHSRTSKGEKQSTDINALADEYLRLAYHGFRARDKNFNAVIETNFDESIGKVDLVPQEIGRVLLNLFNNAFYAVAEKRKLTPVGYEPKVNISSKRQNGMIEVLVKDNGIGIPLRMLDKIFQPFFTTKPTGEGTGLGLSLSYDIVRAHGGELKVESIEGEGASFIVQLPT